MSLALTMSERSPIYPKSVNHIKVFLPVLFKKNSKNKIVGSLNILMDVFFGKLPNSSCNEPQRHFFPSHAQEVVEFLKSAGLSLGQNVGENQLGSHELPVPLDTDLCVQKVLKQLLA